jgi:hypothetical protein
MIFDVHSTNRHGFGKSPGCSVVYSVAESNPVQIISSIETDASAMCDIAEK